MQMEALAQQMQQLTMKEDGKSSKTLLDVVGYQYDNSFKSMMTYQVSASQDIISLGGIQNIKEGAQCQIQIAEDGALHYLDRYMILCELQEEDGFIEDGVSLFEAVQCDLGGFTWAHTNNRFLQRQKLCKMKPHKLKKYERGLGLALSYEKSNTATANELYIEYNEQLIKNNQFNYITEDGVKKLAIPLTFLFEELRQMPDQCIYTGMGQRLKLNLRLSNVSDIMIKTGGGTDYIVNKVQLLRCYTKLDVERHNNILKSRISLPAVKHTWYGVSLSSTGSIINAIYNISKKERVRYLYFGFHPNNASASVNPGIENANTENIVTSRAGGFAREVYPLALIPLPLKQIDLDLGGQVYSYNMQVMSWLHLAGGEESGHYQAFNHPAERAFKTGYVLDLQRFLYDVFGSSSQEITTFRIAITIETGSKSIYGQDAVWSSGAIANGSATIQQYSYQSYLETMQEFELNNGIYQ